MDDPGMPQAESRDIRSSLQATHARVRQARYERELRALSQGRHDGPATNNPVSTSSSHLLMNPGHEAVVLAEAPDTPSRPSAAFNSTVNRSYRPQLDSYLTRRNYDDSATLIGRRIAAREAGQHTPHGESAWSVADIFRRDRDVVPELSSEDFQTQQPLDDRPSESGRGDGGRNDSLPRRRVSGPELDFTRGDLRNVLEPTYPSRGSVSNYSSRSSSLISSVLNMSRRLSLLTEVSLRNFSSPSSTILQSSEFDEPPVPLSSDSPGQTMNGTAEGRRRYVIRRRLDSLGEEVVRHIHLDFEDQALSGLPPGSGERNSAQELSFVRNSNIHHSFPSNMFPSSRLESNLPLSSGPATRRHVWSGLDADGDEIPMDEEEELERLRMDYRVRAQSRIGQRDGPVYSDMPLSESPINDTVPLPYDHLAHESLHGRVVYGSMDDSIAVAGTDAHGRPKVWNDTGPFRPSILPIPLSEMIPSLDSSCTKDHTIPVSEFAHFACR
ncbi:hypothetical protein M378DRAFT_471252 [Amanita muscaria Koide BX008]|uniref:Uncharacterized protein n=1 Tax=Amanita muscaria (strain Koide BX008) TaxID=946122 RepID=A0A0C2X894_AMAMK|nr:hypothetical protein M378DRAFT_471252 [Amanita muscaria Koide BX008]